MSTSGEFTGVLSLRARSLATTPRHRTSGGIHLIAVSFRFSRASAVALLASLVTTPVTRAQEIDTDFESRVDYAFYTENTNTLRTLVRDTSASIDKGSVTPAVRYQLAYAQYRYGESFGDRQPSVVSSSMADCIDTLDDALEAAPAFVEALILQSICYARLASLRSMTAMINGPLGVSRLARARELSPRNPRVLLAEGLGLFWTPRAFDGDRQLAMAKLREAAELFESTSASPGSPRWGHADAYATLGRALHEADDTLGARNALERALLIAPEYAAARRLRAKVIADR
jgi:tetratricopeptide (TPR) repeat protein